MAFGGLCKFGLNNMSMVRYIFLCISPQNFSSKNDINDKVIVLFFDYLYISIFMNIFERVSLCSLVWPRLCYVDQSGLEFIEFSLCLSPAGIKDMCHYARPIFKEF